MFRGRKRGRGTALPQAGFPAPPRRRAPSRDRTVCGAEPSNCADGVFTRVDTRLMRAPRIVGCTRLAYPILPKFQAQLAHREVIRLRQTDESLFLFHG